MKRGSYGSAGVREGHERPEEGCTQFQVLRRDQYGNVCLMLMRNELAEKIAGQFEGLINLSAEHSDNRGLASLNSLVLHHQQTGTLRYDMRQKGFAFLIAQLVKINARLQDVASERGEQMRRQLLLVTLNSRSLHAIFNCDYAGGTPNRQFALDAGAGGMKLDCAGAAAQGWITL